VAADASIEVKIEGATFASGQLRSSEAREPPQRRIERVKYRVMARKNKRARKPEPLRRWGCRKRRGDTSATPRKGRVSDASVQCQIEVGSSSSAHGLATPTTHPPSGAPVCSLCLSGHRPKTLALVPCGHTYHKICIHRLITVTPSRPLLCPECRGEIENVVEFYM
jgi:hypothetical protein